jgi:hypothetical protein
VIPLCQLPTVSGIFQAWRIAPSISILLILGVASIYTAIAADEMLRNVGLYVIP